jgi:hypothetical protein
MYVIGSAISLIGGVMAWYWYLLILVVVLFLWVVNHCRNNLKEQAQLNYWLFGIGNLNVYKGFSVILDHQLGREITESEAYELLVNGHGRARCRRCYQRTKAVIPEKSLTSGGHVHRSLACNKCGCFILNDFVMHIYRR